MEGRIFTLTFKEQTQCSVGWHICLLFHSTIKLLSMWKFKSSRVAAPSRRFVSLLFPFCFLLLLLLLFLYVWAAQCPRFASAGLHEARACELASVCFWGGKSLVRIDLGPTSVVALGHMERPDRARESVGVAHAAVARTAGGGGASLIRRASAVS